MTNDGRVGYSQDMDGIGEVIRKVRREVEMALADGTSIPKEAHLEADRVVLTLCLPPTVTMLAHGLSKKASNGALLERDEGGNRLTIEFRVRSHEAAVTSEIASETTHARALSSDELKSLILETGTAVFGAQGFDNSARAEVFCEVVAGLDIDAVQGALALIETGNSQVPLALDRPVARLRQVLGFSPLGRERAAGRLLQLFRQCTVQEIVTLLGDLWRFGTHWPLPPAN